MRLYFGVFIRMRVIGASGMLDHGDGSLLHCMQGSIQRLGAAVQIVAAGG
jgi:hypothetical protein